MHQTTWVVTLVFEIDASSINNSWKGEKNDKDAEAHHRQPSMIGSVPHPVIDSWELQLSVFH
jgi:hypothetical protein